MAIARQTEKWPDVVATCGAGTVLVEPKAFEETPGSTWRKASGKKDSNLGGGNSNIFYFHPYLGKIPIFSYGDWNR